MTECVNRVSHLAFAGELGGGGGGFGVHISLHISLKTGCGAPRAEGRGVGVTGWFEPEYDEKGELRFSSILLRCLGGIRTPTGGTRIRRATITPQDNCLSSRRHRCVVLTGAKVCTFSKLTKLFCDFFQLFLTSVGILPCISVLRLAPKCVRAVISADDGPDYGEQGWFQMIPRSSAMSLTPWRRM